jgi:RimJ/RimL family protein N-acetyltransferase
MQHILTPRLRLRPLREDDLEGLRDIYTDPRVGEWIGPHSDADVLDTLRFQIAHQAEHGWSLWAVEERETGRLLGDCGLQPLECKGPEVELGYDLHPDTWGRGIATEAARASVEAAFRDFGLDRLIAVVKPHHAASRRVLEKAGLTLAGERQAYRERMLLYEATASRSAGSSSVCSNR